MNNYLEYPYQSQPRVVPQIIYTPTIGSQRINKSVSVIAIILIIALLFVGMKLLSEDGFWQDEKLDWTRGHIDLDTGYADEKGFGEGKAHGMYTLNPIEVGKGIKITLRYGSKMTYQVLAYDESDTFIGTMGNPHSAGLEITQDELTGEFAKTKYIRIYAYEKDGNLNSAPNKEEFSWFDMITKTGNFDVSVLKESNVKDNIDDVTKN